MWLETVRWFVAAVLSILFLLVAASNAALAVQTAVRKSPPFPSLVPAVGFCMLALIAAVAPVEVNGKWLLVLLVVDQGSLPLPLHLVVAWWKRRRFRINAT
jgi:hypothetical protein